LANAGRWIGVTEQSYCRWRKEHSGFKANQSQRMKELEMENAGLRWAVSDPALDELIL
jgi:putative transposase